MPLADNKLMKEILEYCVQEMVIPQFFKKEERN